MNSLSHIADPTKAQINAVAESQEKPRYEAHLRRMGRGRKYNHVFPGFRENHTRIFGETDIFKNLSNED